MFILVEVSDDSSESLTVDWRQLLDERLQLNQLLLVLCFCNPE